MTAASTSGPYPSARQGRPGWTILFLLLITAWGLGMRLFQIGYSSLWADEASSINMVRHGLLFIWTTGQSVDPTPPIYYTLLSGWISWFGIAHEGLLRLPSTLASTATIPLVFLLGRHFTNDAGALLAAALFAFDPIQIYFSQEARCYTLLPLFLSLALLGLVGFAGKAEHVSGSLALYAIGAILLVYTHATSIVTVAALNAGILLHELRNRHGTRLQARIGCLLLADSAVLAAAVPRIWFMLHLTNGVAWIDKPTIVSLTGVFTSFMIDPATPQVHLRMCGLLCVALCVLLGLALFLARPGRLAVDLLVVPPVLFLAIALVESFFKPLLIPRITIWIPVPVCILAAIALQPLFLDRLAPRSGYRPARIGVLRQPLRLALATAVLMGIGLGCHGVYVGQPQLKEDWRGLNAMLARRSRPTDEFIIGPTTSVEAFNFYGALHGNRPYATQAIPVLRWAPAFVEPLHWRVSGILEPARLSTAAMQRDVRTGRPFWIVLDMYDWVSFKTRVMGASAGGPPRMAIDQSHPGLVVVSATGVKQQPEPLAPPR